MHLQDGSTVSGQPLFTGAKALPVVITSSGTIGSGSLITGQEHWVERPRSTAILDIFSLRSIIEIEDVI